METGLTRWRDRWTTAGIPTIPLRPFSKAPVCKSWQTRTPADQWDEAGRGAFRGNIAVTTGNGLAVIDADAPETVEHVEAWLDTAGLEPPTVQSASGTGRHYYITVINAPEGNYTLLNPSVGPGELRYGPGAYVVAPCSLVNGGRYQFTRGYPERIPTMTPIPWRELAWLVSDQTPSAIQDLNRPPVRLLRRPMPDRAKALLRALGDAPKGEPVGHYPTRSEAEAAVVAILALAGWTSDEVLEAFTEHKPGHFTEHAKPGWYVRQVYQSAIAQIASTPERLRIADAYQDAKQAPWPGRGGALEQRTYLALLSKGWQFNTWTVRASQRELAEHAAASRCGVRGALDRLQDADLVRKTQSWRLDGSVARATTWELGQTSNKSPVVTYKTVSGCGDGGRGDGAGAGESAAGASESVAGGGEVWARARLGRSAGMVWERLGDDEPSSRAELARATGKHTSTVKRALGVLEAHGLAQQVLDKQRQGQAAGGWVRGPDDLETVAKELGAARAADRRRMRHRIEREGWHRSLQERDDGQS